MCPSDSLSHQTATKDRGDVSGGVQSRMYVIVNEQLRSECGSISCFPCSFIGFPVQETKFSGSLRERVGVRLHSGCEKGTRTWGVSTCSYF